MVQCYLPCTQWVPTTLCHVVRKAVRNTKEEQGRAWPKALPSERTWDSSGEWGEPKEEDKKVCWRERSAHRLWDEHVWLTCASYDINKGEGASQRQGGPTKQDAEPEASQGRICGPHVRTRNNTNRLPGGHHRIRGVDSAWRIEHSRSWF